MQSVPDTIVDNDEILFAKVEQGDKAAFTEIYRRYHKLLYVISHRYLMDEEMAKDAVQQVFLSLWEHRTKLHIGVSLKNYLVIMTRNHILNVIRDKHNSIVKNYEMAQSAPEYEDNLVENLEKKELMSLFYKALDMLPPQKRDICLLKVQEELSNKEIADQLHLSINTIKTHYSKALKLLRIYLPKMLILVLIISHLD